MKIKYKKLSLSIIIIIVLSLIATGIIVWKLASPTEAKAEIAWFISESIETKEPILLESTYIVSNNEGILEFIHNKETYTLEGNLAKNYFGVADILIDDGLIKKIYAKPNSAEGILLRYTDQDIMLEEECQKENKDDKVQDINVSIADVSKGTGILKRKQVVPVYQVNNNKVTEVDWNSLMVGTSVVKAVMENGQVSALIIEKEIVPQNINVLLTNGESSVYNKIFVRKVYENTMVDVDEVLKNNNESYLVLNDKKGLILCDADQKPMGELYEGELHVFKTKDGLVLVNKLEFETYLKYVIPSEMPKSFSHEALKAQAVCARTYAYMQMKNGAYAEYGANLDDTTNYQVYHSFGRYPETDAAVEETKGEVVLYKGEMINCYYFSSSAGVTNDFSVWGDASCDYIGMRGLEKLEGKDLTKKAQFSEFINSDFVSNDSKSPYYRWDAVLNIESEKESEYGKLKSIQVKERNKSGYVIKLLMVYENKERLLTKESDIRKVIGMYLTETTLSNKETRTNLTMIPSACFEVKETSDSTIVLRGGGYGHAIGLSQYGSDKLGKDGKTYEEIIKYYYKNVDIGSL